MKFIKGNSDGCGSSHVALTFEEERMLSANQTNIQYRKGFYPKISKAWDIDTDKRPTLFATWEYYLFYNGNQIYYFHSDKSYRIEEIETPPTDTDLKNILIESHNYLKTTLEERKNEYRFIISVQDVSADTIQETFLSRLKEALLPPIK